MMQWLSDRWHDFAHWPIGWLTAAALALIGAWRETAAWLTRKTDCAQIAELQRRLDKIESGATYREMQRFCEHATHIVSEAQDRMEAMRREMNALAAKVAEGEKRLSAALLECARWEEKVQRMLAGQR